MKKEMRGTKVFNVNRCPYAQILEYKGDMIIIVDELNYLKKISNSDGLVRYYNSKKDHFFYANTSAHSPERFRKFQQSCFSRGFYTFEQKVKQMKNWDIGENKINHIIFL